MARLLIFLMVLVVPVRLAAEDARVCFTPGDECTDMVVDAIDRARRDVQVQAYSFTSPDIAQALARARRRGVEVAVIVDRSQAGNRSEGRAVDTLLEAGVAVLVDRAHAIAHNKVMVIDGATVVTGSFNFTRAAQERNAENLLLLRDRDLAGRYAANWLRHAQHSLPWSDSGR
jgi:phosphatidylserine/phosphatidylglycerophosphate/cardiolipin synthase-like enzyme